MRCDANRDNNPGKVDSLDSSKDSGQDSNRGKGKASKRDRVANPDSGQGNGVPRVPQARRLLRAMVEISAGETRSPRITLAAI
jgi:hypothetical protein